jgi:hypothetical protein
MAQPAQQPLDRPEAPPLDPHAVDRAYHLHRAKRRARIEHQRATKYAHLRFWVFLGLLLLAVAVVGVTVWSEIAKLFGI